MMYVILLLITCVVAIFIYDVVSNGKKRNEERTKDVIVYIVDIENLIKEDIQLTKKTPGFISSEKVEYINKFSIMLGKLEYIRENIKLLIHDNDSYAFTKQNVKDIKVEYSELHKSIFETRVRK